ncbi:nad dependent epimerase [Colletotrichum truncatum]|uniref:Nad dependent epimerase n=1 Tax=Colletotrichum truncatum TaxID=5467 RepID=A0ACC3YW13_COLTU|nr:nad dependent epimerase [Colletotrichum truncatum]KAF6791133.1 nad dependent epimerase [Colletotrichum truncatum]
MATVQERHPELFRPVSTESPRGKKRTVPLEVLCLGFPRTGTMSMCAALEKLGITCWHSTSFLSTNFADIEMWQEAVDRKFFGAQPNGNTKPVGREEFDQLLHSFGAVSSDTPAVAFAEELIAAYPEAKVVLVERDTESWYKSFMEGIIVRMYAPWTTVVYNVDHFYCRPIGKIHKSVLGGWLDIWNTKDAELKLRDSYRQHYDLVRRVTPKERLLEFNLADGWEPLCEFLGKPVPDVPFPHLNEKRCLEEKIGLIISHGLKALGWRVATYGGPLVVAGVALWMYM